MSTQVAGEPEVAVAGSARPDVDGTRLVRNTLANGVASVVGAALTIVLTPILLTRLGPDEYGIWLLAATLTLGNGFLALADLGLTEATVLYVAEARAAGDMKALNELVSTVTWFFAGLGLLVGAGLAGMSGVLAGAFVDGSPLRSTAVVVFVLVGAQIAVNLPMTGLLALVQGTQHYGWYQALGMGTRVVWSALVVAAVVAGHGVTALAVLSIAVAVAGALATVLVAHRLQPGLRVRPSLARRRALARVFGYGRTLLAMRFLSVVYSQMDRLILGLALGTAAVASYEVAFKVHATATLTLAVAASAIVPAAAYMAAASDHERLRRLYLRGTKYAIAASLPVTVAAIVYARALIVAWVGPAYASLAGETRLFLLYPALMVVHWIGLAMMVGLGRMRETVRLYALSVLLNLGLSLALVPHFGIAGVIWGTLLGYLATWVPYARILLRSFGSSVGDLARQTLAPNLAPLAAQVAFCLVTLRLVERLDALWAVAAAGAASCALSLAVFAVFGLDGPERRSLARSLRPGRRRPAAATA